MNRILLFSLNIVLISYSPVSPKLTDFTYSTCIEQTANSEFTPPKLVETKSQKDEIMIKLVGSANCDAELKGKIEIIGKQILLYYTINGLEYNYYTPKLPPEPVVQMPEPHEIDSAAIKEVLINLCYCRYTLIYSIKNPPTGFEISLLNNWDIK